MTNKSKKIAAAGLVAASYAVITIVFGAISYGPFQFRISEMLMFLPLFGTEYILGLTIGCFIANITGGLGLVDMVFGTLATLISCILVYYTPKLIKNEKLSLFVASLWPTIVNALIIGWELYKFFGLPFGLSALQVGFGEFVVITIVGLPVFKIVNNKYVSKFKNLSSK